MGKKMLTIKHLGFWTMRNLLVGPLVVAVRCQVPAKHSGLRAFSVTGLELRRQKSPESPGGKSSEVQLEPWEVAFKT